MNKNIKTKNKARQFRTAWTELVPNTSLGGMTLPEFNESISVLDTLQGEIDALLTQLDAKRAERSIEEARIRDQLDMVATSIRANPQYGRDSAVYSAFGFIRQSQRKSGLIRKTSPTVMPAAAAPVAPTIVPSGIFMGGNNGTGGVSAA
jgi:hypothetical protein